MTERERSATHCEYTPDQQRAADYIVEVSGIGGGDDPVGFLIASHAALRDRLLAEAPTDLPSNGCIALTYGKLKAALKELLRLYDWRNEIGTIERDFNHDKKQVKTWLNQYGREKKTAWHIARETLSGAPDIDSLMLHERIQREAQMRTKSATEYIEPIEVCSALRWTLETFESTLAGKVVVNADEVISNAKRVLEKWEIK